MYKKLYIQDEILRISEIIRNAFSCNTNSFISYLRKHLNLVPEVKSNLNTGTNIT